MQILWVGLCRLDYVGCMGVWIYSSCQWVVLSVQLWLCRLYVVLRMCGGTFGAGGVQVWVNGLYGGFGTQRF